MFNMSDFSIVSQSIEKSYTFPFKDTTVDPVAPNWLDMLPRQNRIRKFTFLLLALT